MLYFIEQVTPFALITLIIVISLFKGIRGEIDYQKWNKSVRLRKDKI
jgi:choline-glycine betaine transporter